MRKVKQAIEDLSGGKIQVFRGVTRGIGADVSGDKYSLAISTWRNKSDQIGIEYNAEKTQAYSLGWPKANAIRREISHKAKNFAKKLRYEQRKVSKEG